jgi:peptide/nickel transport system substrate-binding protein
MVKKYLSRMGAKRADKNQKSAESIHVDQALVVSTVPADTPSRIASMRSVTGSVRKSGRRLVRVRKKQLSSIADSTNKQIDRHIFKKFESFSEVARFGIAWVLLVVLLVGGVLYQVSKLRPYYIHTVPVAGGVYTEGLVGTLTNPNPLFANTSTDLAVSKLIFSSLLSYDQYGELQNDLAESVQVDERGLVYTVVLKKGVKWHDGVELTSTDILYTYNTIKNPDTKSPYNSSWQGVSISASDPYTALFTLSSPVNSFLQSLTIGIVPEHILGKTPPAGLRSAEFNQNLVGTGPFKDMRVSRIDNIESIAKEQRIELVKSESYFKGEVQLDSVVVYTFSSDEKLSESIESRRVDAGVFSEYPAEILARMEGLTLENIPLLSGVYVFYNTTSSKLSDQRLRQALHKAIDTKKLLSLLQYPTIEVDSPLLKRQTDFYDSAYSQFTYDLPTAKAELDALGWILGDDGVRYKDGNKLELTLTTIENGDLSLVAIQMAEDFRAELGVQLNIVLKSQRDIQQATLTHDYEMFLYGINIGADPDVYAYWHSSQASTDKFNLSLYKSTEADKALEAGRTRTDAQLRQAKYKPFYEAWRKDVPATGLYQPAVFYVRAQPVYDASIQYLNSVSDRFSSIYTWKISTSDQLKLSSN